MLTIDSLPQAFEEIKDRYGQEKVKKKFAKFQKDIQLNFEDSDKHFLIRINLDQGIEIVEENHPDNEVQVNFVAEEILLQILNKELGGVKAYSSGKIKVDGKLRDLLKLKALMF